MLGVFNFRLGSRKFIQELFLDVQFSKVCTDSKIEIVNIPGYFLQMDDEAMHVLGLGNL